MIIDKCMRLPCRPSSSQQGIYFYDNFTIPVTNGVYPYLIDCVKAGRHYYSANTFHVRDIDADVWNFTSRVLTNFSFDVVNETEIANEVWTYTPRQLTYFNHTATAEQVWYWTGIIYPNILGNYSENMWNWTARYTHGEDLT